MASRFGKTPLRTLSAQAAAAAARRVEPTSSLNVTKLPNGLTVASSDNGSRLSSLSVLVKAGSRYETYDQLGVSHVLRASLGLRSTNYTGFAITRNIQQAGSCLAATGGRDFVGYEAQFLREKDLDVVSYMFDAVANPQFKRWELPAAKEKVAFQVAEMEPHIRAVELLYRAAYRDGLGNSLFCPEHMLGKHRPRDLEAYHQKTFTAERTVIVGDGINHDDLVTFAGNLTLGSGKGPSAAAAKFHLGGDERHHTTGPVAHIAMAADGGNPNANYKDASAMYCLTKILGDGQKVKYGVPSGVLAKALPPAGVHSVSGLYLGSDDASLVGFFLATEAANAGENLSKVVAALRNLKVTDAEFKAAKNAVKVESQEYLLDPTYRCQMIGTGQASPSTQWDALVDAVTIADVKAAAKKLAGAKFSLGACGNLANVPYVDTL